MQTFNRNLDAYHSLNAMNDLYTRRFQVKLLEAKTTEEIDAIMDEAKAHFDQEEIKYRRLGEEMVEIMSKKWWQFWK